MYKKIISVLMVGVMAVCCASCSKSGGDSSANDSAEENSNQLEILKSDFSFTQEQSLSRIKAEYLKENNGYKPDDEIVAIINLPQSPIIDGYLESGYSGTLADYASGAAGKNAANVIAADQRELTTELYAKGLIKEVNYSYSTVLNAVSVTAKYGDLQKIEKLASVENVTLSDTYNLPQSASTAPSAILNNVDVYETGIFNSGSVSFTGKGTAVAILDSGFDCSHSVFAKQPADLWIERGDVGKVLNETNAAKTTSGLALSDVWYSNKIPFVYDYADKDNDVFPYDSEHGTHVAGIIGGSDDEITGVAVDTQLVLLKVFPDLDSGAQTDDILAALEDAVLLGVDAINLSLGSSCGFSREEDGSRINEVYDKINASGISLITAASNSYSSGFGGEQGNTNFVTNPDSSTVGSPSTYPTSLSVASISGTKSRYLMGNGEQVIFFAESNSITGDPNDFVKELGITEGMTKTFEYVTVPGVGLRVNYATLGDLTGKIALVRRGDNTFEDKALNAKNAGAAACIIYNNIDGDINMSMGKTDHIPTISISKDNGTILAERDTGTITVSYENQAGPFMSDFSSWGPTPDLKIKPEITAHGGDIRSAVPGGGYDNLSGTSMASPNLCGIVVLIRQYLKEKFPDYTTKQVSVLANQLLMSTATIVLNEKGNPYSPRKQGAGLASLYNVVNTKAYLTVDGIDRTKIELNDDPKRTGVYDLNFNLVNLSDSALTYNLGFIGMTETVSTSDPTHVAESDQILGGWYKAEAGGQGSLSGGKVTVEPNGTATVSIKYTLTDADKNMMNNLFPYGMYVEGFVKLTAEDGNDIDLSVPFLAFYGDWTQAPIFDKTYYEVESEAHNKAIDDEDKLKADYYATTPYGSYYYNYIIPLGTYLYDIDENAYDAIPASEDHIAISNILGSIDGISSVYGGLLRNAKTMTYSIVDKVTGEEVWHYVDPTARKASSLGGSPIPYNYYMNLKSQTLGLINNRQYSFKMFAELDYGDGGATTNARNAFEFDFYLDDEAPVLKSATYEKVYDKTLKKDRFYVNLTIYDNQYVMSVSPIVFTSSSSYAFLTENPIPVYSEKGKDNTIRIEITDYLENLYADVLINNALAFSIDDYALNSNIYLCQLPGTRGDFKFTRDGTMNGGELTTVTLYEDEVVDLTEYLATADKTVDADKDYLKYLNWESSNEEVATVYEGLVVGKKAGRTMVTVTELMDLKRAMIFINVRQREEAAPVKETKSAAKEQLMSVGNKVDNASSGTIKSVRFAYFDTLFAYSRSAQRSEIGSTGDRFFISAFPGDTVSFYPGEKIKLSYDMDPWYIRDKYKVTYASTNENVAVVNDDGEVTALKKGTATITLKVEGSNLMARLRVNVNSEFIIENRTLIAYKGLGGDVVIPDDEGILYIGPYSFCLYETDRSVELTEEDLDANKIPAENTTITSIKVPYGVEDVQKYAFFNCRGLRSVELPETVKFVREYAFYNDEKLSEVNLDRVETIGREAFRGCKSLETVNLGKAYAIGVKGFQDCVNLAYANLSALRNAGEEIFRGCENLTSITMTPNTKLSRGMFAYSGLTSVEIFERIQIPSYCFYHCESLKTVTLPDNDIMLGEFTFSGCTELEELKFKADTQIIKISGSIFDETQFTTFSVVPESKYYSVSAGGNILLNKAGDGIMLASTGVDYGDLVIGNQYKYIGEGAFSGADVKTLTIVNPLIEIGNYAFASCPDLSIVTLPETGVAVIGTHAFNNCKKLFEVTNLGKVKTIGDYALARTNIQNATIAPNAEVGEGAFYLSNIETVTIGTGAKFGLGAFQRCSHLTTVNMPDGNVSFGETCFAYDVLLSKIDLSKLQRIENQTFYGCSALVSANMLSVVEIGSHAFADCSALSYVAFPEVETIGEGAFGRNSTTDGGAPVFSEVTLPDTLKNIGDGVFIGCGGLTKIIIPSTLTRINDFMFAYCENLVEVVLPEKVTEIGVYSFAGCEMLNKINLGGVTEVKAYAFTSCKSLEKVDLSKVKVTGYGSFADTLVTGDITANELEEVGGYTFQGANILSFTAPNLKKIGAYAFQNNRRMTGFVFSDKLESVGSLAFHGCTELKDYSFIDESGAKLTDGTINENALLDNGVLYTKMASGKLQLTSVPAGKEIDTLEVKEGTYRIDMYAGNENKNISYVSLPDSLKLIGNYAFYGMDKLRIVEFRSFTAPMLESRWNRDAELSETDAGYGLLHNQFDLFGFELCYYTFIDLAGKKAPINIIVPANDGLVGYDGIIYEAYFGKISAANKSNYVAKYKSLTEFIELAEQIKGIETITAKDEKIINSAVTYYNSLKQSGVDYGYTGEEWQSLVDCVQAAKARLGEIKIQNASFKVRSLQEKINSLPDKYSKKVQKTLDEIASELETLKQDEKLLLDLTGYNALLLASEEGGEGLSATELVLAIVIPSVAVLAAGAAVAIILIKRQRRAK